MWETVSKVKNLAGLAAVALAVAYLLSDKLIESGRIGNSMAVAMLLGFLVVFVFGVMILAIVGKAVESSKKTATTKIVGSGNKVEQSNKGGDGSRNKLDADIAGDDNEVKQANE